MIAKAPLPEGFRYEPDLLDLEAEARLLAHFSGLVFRPVEFHGILAHRRVVSFGFRYDFNGGKLEPAELFPDYLYPVRERVATIFGLPGEAIVHAMVTEYSPEASIGWHRDRSVFGEVIGISLASACTFRFRRKRHGKWERASLCLAPRSVYLLSGPARTDWQHSIPAVASLRYSITFRTLRAGKDGGVG